MLSEGSGKEAGVTGSEQESQKVAQDEVEGAVGRILSWDRKPLEMSEHTNAKIWKF